MNTENKIEEQNIILKEISYRHSCLKFGFLSVLYIIISTLSYIIAYNYNIIPQEIGIFFFLYSYYFPLFIL